MNNNSEDYNNAPPADKRKLELILSDEEKIRDKASKEDVSRFRKLVNQLKLAVQLVKDYKSKAYTDIPWRSLGLIATAILYFLNPFDLIPDILPVMGFADDAVLFAAIFKSLKSDLEKYAQWKGLDIDEYF